MRPRKFEELNDPERIARLARSLSPHHTPKVIRNYIRNHYVVELIDWMFDVVKGDEKFEVLDKDGKVVSLPATPAVRAQVAREIVNFATIGASVHHLGDDNESVQGAIALPPLELAHAQRRLHAGAAPGKAGTDLDAVETTEYTIPVPTNGNGHHHEE